MYIGHIDSCDCTGKLGLVSNNLSPVSPDQVIFFSKNLLCWSKLRRDLLTSEYSVQICVYHGWHREAVKEKKPNKECVRLLLLIYCNKFYYFVLCMEGSTLVFAMLG